MLPVYEPVTPFRGYSCWPSTTFPRSSEHRVTCSFMEPSILLASFQLPVHSPYHLFSTWYVFAITRRPLFLSLPIRAILLTDAQQWYVEMYLRRFCLFTTLTFILPMWRIGWASNSIPIYIQQDATLHSLFISGSCSACFGWYLNPSSGAHTTVSTASVICHTVTAICRYRGRVGTGLSVLWVAYATMNSTSSRPVILPLTSTMIQPQFSPPLHKLKACTEIYHDPAIMHSTSSHAESLYWTLPRSSHNAVHLFTCW
jgi:hypothetical protein